MKRFFISLATGVLAMLLLSPVAFAGKTYVTSAGIGKVKTGAAISELPQQISGVYDKLELVSVECTDEGTDEETVPVYRATLGGETVFEFYPEDDKVESITVYSHNIKTKKGLGLDSTPSELLSAGGKVISFNDGGEAILCDGLLFKGMPMTPQGQEKSQQAYFGDAVSFDLSDFEADGHPTEIVISEYYASEYSEPSQSISWENVLGVIVTILFILAILAMIGHMVYVNYFMKPYPEEVEPGKGNPENNEYVKSTLGKLYNEEFTSLSEPGNMSESDEVRYPVGKKAAFHAKEALDDIMANHLPVDGEAATLLEKVAIATNDAYKREFAGSKPFLIVTAIIGIVLCCIMKEAFPIIYFGLSCVMYWFASRTPNYILIENEIKNVEKGKTSKNFITAAIAGILGLAASAPVYVNVTKDADNGEVLDKSEDHSMTWVALVITVVLLFVVAYMMFFVALFNYLRNYVFRK